MMPVAERFKTKYRVDQDTGCWLWIGSRQPKGYGKFWPNKRRCVLAHRWSYESSVGPIPDGLQIDHLCRNPRCVNPEHLEPVTRKVNLLRGDGFPGQNVRKTHCPKGHPLEGDNLYRCPRRGCRTCRECMRVASRQWRERQKNARPAALREPSRPSERLTGKARER